MWIEQLRQDVGYAVRGFGKARGFTTIVIATLAFGIGANTALFSVMNAIFLRPLPYRDANRIVVVWQLNQRDRSAPPFFDSYNDFRAFAARSRSFDQVAAATWAVGGRIFSGRGAPRDVLALPVSVNFFSLLGRSAALGRVFEESDLGRGCTVVLRDKFWRNALNGRPDVVGHEIRLDDQTCTVAGVMPPDVTFFPDALSMWRLITPLDPMVRDPEHAAVAVLAHLRPGVSLASAQGELQQVFRDAHRNDRLGAERIPVAFPLQEQFSYLTGPNLRLSLLVLFAGVSLVLLIACLNVANLLLGRFQARHKELAVRAALGSGRGRLIRQLLTESLLLSVGGAGLGLLFAEMAVRLFRAVDPVPLPPGNPVEINLGVLLYTSVLAVATTVLFGLIPAWKATRVDIQEALKAAVKGAGRTVASQRLARALVAVEITFSLVLLVGAGLLLRSVERLASAPL